MNKNSGKITVYYDGACPSCVKDRQNYERWTEEQGEGVCWFDITGQEHKLREIGIDPGKALTELHVSDEAGNVRVELDAYVLLLNRIRMLKPVAWFIGLPLVRPLLSLIYRRMVERRLRRSGRL